MVHEITMKIANRRKTKVSEQWLSDALNCKIKILKKQNFGHTELEKTVINEKVDSLRSKKNK